MQAVGGALDTRTAMRSMLARKPINVGGPARLTDLPPLMDTDTSAISDGVKIIAHYKDFKRGQRLVSVFIGDGQTCLTLSYLKRRWPNLYKHILIMNGHFHSRVAT